MLPLNVAKYKNDIFPPCIQIVSLRPFIETFTIISFLAKMKCISYSDKIMKQRHQASLWKVKIEKYLANIIPKKSELRGIENLN